MNVQKCGEAAVSARNLEIRLKLASVPGSGRQKVHVLFINKEELQKVLSGVIQRAEIVRLSS